MTLERSMADSQKSMGASSFGCRQDILSATNLLLLHACARKRSGYARDCNTTLHSVALDRAGVGERIAGRVERKFDSSLG